MTSPADPGAHACWLVRVRGRVQGVGFREACMDRATQLGVTGWVRNRLDGTVEALLHGDAARCAQLAQWAERGPPAARVSRVERFDAAAGDPAELTPGFERRPTA